METITFVKTTPPEWLLPMWKEIEDKTFGKGFDYFAENAICNLGVAHWHGREAIRNNLRQFIDKAFTAHHDVVEYWDSPLLKVFHGKVGMKSPSDVSGRLGRLIRAQSRRGQCGSVHNALPRVSPPKRMIVYIARPSSRVRRDAARWFAR
jgi:hypothetical protein